MNVKEALTLKHSEEIVAFEEFHDLTFQWRALHDLQLFPELFVIVFIVVFLSFADFTHEVVRERHGRFSLYETIGNIKHHACGLVSVAGMFVSYEEVNTLHLGETIVVLVVDDKRIVGWLDGAFRHYSPFAAMLPVPDAVVVAKALIAQHLECIRINIEAGRHCPTIGIAWNEVDHVDAALAITDDFHVGLKILLVILTQGHELHGTYQPSGGGCRPYA